MIWPSCKNNDIPIFKYFNKNMKCNVPRIMSAIVNQAKAFVGIFVSILFETPQDIYHIYFGSTYCVCLLYNTITIRVSSYFVIV
jgi:hypothetical protein